MMQQQANLLHSLTNYYVLAEGTNIESEEPI